MITRRGPELDGRRARLVVRAPHGTGPVDGVVLVLHGGRARSTAATSATQLAVVRLVPFATAASKATREAGLRVAVARLRYRVRGWNGRREDPVVDTRWALDALREQFGDVPTVLVGHSMGGRVALALADAPGVVGVLGLAPWVDPHDTVGAVAGRRVDVLHGTADRMTDPQASRGWTALAARRGADVRYTPVDGAGHTMLGRAGWWHRTAAAAVVADLQAALATPAAPRRSGVAGHGTGTSTRQDVHQLGTPDRTATTSSRRQS